VIYMCMCGVCMWYVCVCAVCCVSASFKHEFLDYVLIFFFLLEKSNSKLQGGLMMLLLLSSFSCVWLWATPQTAAHQAPLSLGFYRQEHWSGLPFPSPMHESEKWKWSHSVVSDSSWPHGLQPTRLLNPWGFPGKCTGVGCYCLLWG